MTTYPTLLDALRASFGERADRIGGFQDTINFAAHAPSGWTGPALQLTEKGVPFASCGGEVLMSWHRADGLRGTVYLVRDSSEYDHWAFKRARDIEAGRPTSGTAPEVQWRLAYSV